MSESTDIDRVSMIVLRAMRTPLTILMLVYAGGIAGFAVIPGTDGSPMSFLHATYFLSYTATTTGFGEIPLPFSDAQRLWAIVLLHVSVVAWLYSVGAILRLVQNEHFRRALSQHVFARRVRGMREPFAIVCGFGDAGSLLARGMAVLGIPGVIIDNDEDRIKALKLRSYDVPMIGVCADSGDPRQLLNAGLRNPRCRGIVAMTDEEHVNLTTTVMTRVLNTHLTPICRVDTRRAVDELGELGPTVALDYFEVFADKLCLALSRPVLHTLEDWLVRAPGVTLEHRTSCPVGPWIICGYGRMGRRLEKGLKDQGVSLTVIDPDMPEEEDGGAHIRGSANRGTLRRAGIDETACVIVGTDDDATNLRVAMVARELNPAAFLAVRQNHYANEPAFLRADVDLIMHPDRILSRRIQLELISPALPALLDHLRACPMGELLALIERLRDALGDEAPLLWVERLDAAAAPAFEDALAGGESGRITLRDLMRDPRRRDELLGCVPLVLERDGEQRRVPTLDAPLEPDDEVLFCGSRHAKGVIGATVANPYTLAYLITGEERARGHLFRWLAEQARPIRSVRGPGGTPRAPGGAREGARRAAARRA